MHTDIPALLEVYSEDIAFHGPGVNAGIQGHEALKALLERIFSSPASTNESGHDSLGYSSSVRWSPHSVSPSVNARWAMKWSGAAPCQCHSPGGVTITSPARMRISGPPRAWTKPSPSVTHRVCPKEWRCQAVWAHGVKCTQPSETGDGPCPWARGSTYT